MRIRCNMISPEYHHLPDITTEMTDPNTYPGWIDAKTEISDAHPVPFVKFKLSRPFPNFKSRDRLWITDDNILITYMCDPRDIGQNARKVRNIKVKFALSKVVSVSLVQQKEISIVSVESSTDIITTTQRHKLGKVLFFYFRDADKAIELKNIIRSNGDNVRLSSSPASSSVVAGAEDSNSLQSATQVGNNGSIYPNANGGPTTKSVTISDEAPQIIAPESDKGDDNDDDQTLDLPFGTQIPRKRAASVSANTQHKIPAISVENTKFSPQPDHEDEIEDLLKYEEIRDLKATIEGIAIQFAQNLIKEQKRVQQAQKALHANFWQKVEAGKKEKEKDLHKIDKDFMDSVPSIVQKSQAFHQTLRNGFTTFPTITQVITRAIESVEKANNSLASLRPTFDK